MGSRHELRDSVGQASGAGDVVMVLEGMPVMPGEADGIALVSDEPLSFWGGYDWKTGEIIDRRHPLSGQIAAGKILCVPFTRGSSTTTAVLLEAIRAGTAPAAIITTATDFFFALASVVADEMYKKPLALVSVDEESFRGLKTGDRLKIERSGRIEIGDE
jgi:hypothetical protein